MKTNIIVDLENHPIHKLWNQLSYVACTLLQNIVDIFA